MQADYYEILEIDHTAASREIRRAYRRLAKQAHPDLHSGISGQELHAAEAWMALLDEAMETLSDPKRRAAYDRMIRVPGRGIEAAARWTPPPIPHGFLLYPGKEWGKADSGVIRALDSKLRALSLSAYTTDFSGLAAFAPNRLWALSAERMPVPDEQLAHLSDITSLTKLELDNTEITDAGLAHLIPLKGLAELLLFGTKITDHGLRLIGRFPNLKNLNLGETAVTDEGLAHLSQLALLDTLNLRGTQVRGPGLRNLHRLKGLDWLALSMNVDRDAKRAIKAALPDLEIV